jgi:hypothetical protein
MILVDLSQTIISNIIVHFKNELKKNSPDAKRLIKHSTLNTLLSYKKKYGAEFGELVLACDGKSYWRRDFFPAYKGHRKHAREESDMDWGLVFETINELKEDIREYFKFKVIEVDGAEADDVIACLVKYSQDNELVQEGLFDGEPQKILICSADQDFVQLQKYPNVKQYSIIQKKWLKESNVTKFLVEHVCHGDDSDNIPNILTPDSWAITRSKGEKPPRANSVKKTFIDDFKLIDFDNADEKIKRNYIRNRTLIDFDFIPSNIYNSVIAKYQGYESKGNKTKLMSYFMSNGMKLLFAEINNF